MKAIDQIINLGSVFYNVEKSALTSPRRDDPLVRIRFSIMGACREEGHALQRIGDAFNRDHGTVLHAVKRLNPSSMGSLWENHVRFLETIKARVEMDDKPILDVVSATKIAIEDIDKKISALAEIRDTMANSLALFQKNMDIIQTL